MKRVKVLLLIHLLIPTFTVGLCFGAVNNPNVTISSNIQDSGVGLDGGQMSFSNNNLAWSSPEPYAAMKIWDVSNSGFGGNNLDGLKTIYAKFSDTLGNWMPGAITTTVELIRPSPTFSGIEINIAPSAATSTAGVTPININDGDYLNYWRGAVGDTVSVDFRTARRVSRIKLYPYGATGTNTAWKVEYSTPAAPDVWNEFQNVAMLRGVGRKGKGISIVSGGDAVMYDFVFPDLVVQSVRFSVQQGASDGNAYLSEIEVFQNTGIKHQIVEPGMPILISDITSFFNSSYNLIYTVSPNISINMQTGSVAIAAGWTGAVEAFIIATDEHGNMVESNMFVVAVVMPSEKPVIESFGLSDASYGYTTHTSGTASVALTTTGNVVGYFIKEDSVTPTASDFILSQKPATYVITAVTNGSVTVSAWVLSDIGEISEVATYTISLDKEPPTGVISISIQ